MRDRLCLSLASVLKAHAWGLQGSNPHLTPFLDAHRRPAERPIAYRRTLELAAHIDAARIRARLEGGVLSILFPYLRRPQPRPSYSWIVVERPPAPAPCQQAPAPAHTVRSVPKLSSARVPVVHVQRGPAARQQVRATHAARQVPRITMHCFAGGAVFLIAQPASVLTRPLPAAPPCAGRTPGC